MNKNAKIYIAGHKGMVGGAVKRLLQQEGYTNLIYATSKELDLTDAIQVKSFFEKHKPEYVILAAAKVGGIQANIDNPAVFLYDNLAIQNNIIHQAYLNGTEKLVFLGSSCIYPKEASQPMKEEYLLTGKLEPTNEAYALAKIAGLKLCQMYYRQYGFKTISLMPCNLYGEGDSFDLKHSHVLSALVKRFSDAKVQNTESITLWGTGIAQREFMNVTDCAKSVLFMMENYTDYDQFINIGWGEDISIKDLAHLIAKKVGYQGKIEWDSSKPNGMLKKCMEVSRMKEMGFVPTIDLEEGIDQMIESYQKTLS
ncbi:MAG: GDP-fucose synthetase [Flexibacter sp. CG_4_10_14_3_um_filter_32_15]|nr:MAG: GDP-fucose synthetase [Flexibacter sp. CG_4_10_14_3_um_filter_32_15]